MRLHMSETIKIILCGCLGHMGRAVAAAASTDGRFEIMAGVDAREEPSCAFPVYTAFDRIPDQADVIIDFSHHTVLPSLCSYAVRTNTPAVICTTGHTEEEADLMKHTSQKVGIFFSRNMSVGINLLIRLVRQAARTLGEEYDIEIIEKHHNRKLDAPSGTALMIADALSSEFEDGKEYVYDRQSVRKARDKREIGISSVRGGNIVGEHEVLFCGHNETIAVSHEAMSREVFADGALRAAAFMKDRKAGFYTMEDLLTCK